MEVDELEVCRLCGTTILPSQHVIGRNGNTTLIASGDREFFKKPDSSWTHAACIERRQPMIGPHSGN